MAYLQTIHLERELMFKNTAEPTVKYQLGNCQLGIVPPNHVRIDVTEGSNAYYNYVASVTVGRYDNVLCVESQNGVTFLMFERRDDRDEWYSTIKQLQLGKVPSFPTKRESLPARLADDTTTRSLGRSQTSASSPSSLQQIFKEQLERDIKLKKPELKTGSGSYVNMDYNRALQDSKESYNMFNVLQEKQNVPVEDDTYEDVPDEDNPHGLIEEDIYEDLEDAIEEDIYDDPNNEDDVYEDNVVPGLPGASGWSSDEPPPPALPPRPSTMPRMVVEEDDVYELPNAGVPPPIPARPPTDSNIHLDQNTAGKQTRKMFSRQSKKQANQTTNPTPPKIPSIPTEGDRNGPKINSTVDQTLTNELAMTLRTRAATVPNRPHSPNHSSQNSSKKPVALPSGIEKVQLRSPPDRHDSNPRPSSSEVSDELARKLAKRNSAISSDSTGSGLHGQTPCDQTCNSNDNRRGSVSSVKQHVEPTSPPWKQSGDQSSQPPKTPAKKKAIVPPPTLPGKFQPKLPTDDQMKTHISPPPTPVKKPVKPPPSDEIYEDTEVGPPAVKPKPKRKPSLPSPVAGGEELDLRIPLHAIQDTLAGSVTFKDQSDNVVVERSNLLDYLHVGDQILKIGDIDVRNSSAMFVTECWKRVSENQVRVRIFR